MKIKITELKDGGNKHFRYCADRPELSGSPSVGYGKTPKEALGDLIYSVYEDLGITLELPKKEYKRIKKEYLKAR